MKDMTAHLEKLRIDAEDCALISNSLPMCKSESYSQGSQNTWACWPRK